MPNTPFARNIAAIATPFKADLGVDFELLIAHARWLFDHGCDGILLFGTTGEAVSLTTAERRQTLETLISGGIPAAKILVGTGCCAVADAIDLTRHAADAGAAGALILPPYFYKGVSDDGLARYFDFIISGCGTSLASIYLYHIPQLAGAGISPDLLGRLVERHGDQIRGYKDSSGDWSNTGAILARFPALDVYVGSETLLLRTMRAGGAGCISATVNIQPATVRAVVDTWHSGDSEGPHSTAIAVRKTLESFGTLVPAVKAALARIHGRSSWAITRPPLDSLADAATDRLLFELSMLGPPGL